MSQDNDAEVDTARPVVASAAKVIPLNRGRLADPRARLIEKLRTWTDLLRVGAPIGMVFREMREVLERRKAGGEP